MRSPLRVPPMAFSARTPAQTTRLHGWTGAVPGQGTHAGKGRAACCGPLAVWCKARRLCNVYCCCSASCARFCVEKTVWDDALDPRGPIFHRGQRRSKAGGRQAPCPTVVYWRGSMARRLWERWHEQLPPTGASTTGGSNWQATSRSARMPSSASRQLLDLRATRSLRKAASASDS